MLCCFQKNTLGNCIICLKPCRTKACKCSYYHKQCMNSFIKRKRVCSICNCSFKTFFLENEPKETEEEISIIQEYKLRHRINTVRKIYQMKKYFNIVAPFIIKMYPYICNYKKVFVIPIINDIISDQNQYKTLYQRFLDSGIKSIQANELLKTLERISFEYDTYPNQVKASIHNVFMKKIKCIK